MKCRLVMVLSVLLFTAASFRVVAAEGFNDPIDEAQAQHHKLAVGEKFQSPREPFPCALNSARAIDERFGTKIDLFKAYTEIAHHPDTLRLDKLRANLERAKLCALSMNACDITDETCTLVLSY